MTGPEQDIAWFDIAMYNVCFCMKPGESGDELTCELKPYVCTTDYRFGHCPSRHVRSRDPSAVLEVTFEAQGHGRHDN